MDEFLYQLGTGIPFVFIFSITTAIGYRIRGPLGVTLATAILAAFFAFGAVTRAWGSSLTQHTAAIALGTSAVCTVTCFAIVYQVVGLIDAKRSTYGRFASITAMSAVGGIGVAITIGAAVLLAGFPLLVAIPTTLPLLVSFMLLAIPAALAESRNVNQTALEESPAHRPSSPSITSRETPASSKWNITRRPG